MNMLSKKLRLDIISEDEKKKIDQPSEQFHSYVNEAAEVINIACKICRRNVNSMSESQEVRTKFRFRLNRDINS